MKRTLAIIGTAGHVDHGKTSLIKALTGIDTDRLKQERERGVSIELGFAHVDLSEGEGGEMVRAAIVDVPGHERFIRNMLAGITGIDVVLFVVAADDGVMPQTIEHLDIVRLLGVRSGVFAVTKCDLVSPERAGEVEAGLKRLLAGTGLEGSPMVRVSTVTGQGVGELKGLLYGLLPEKRETGGFFRLPVDRSFAIKGFGTVVTGTVASGSIRKGDGVRIYPAVTPARVRGLQSLYTEVDEVSAGERAAVNITGVGHRDIQRGDVLTTVELAGFCPPEFRSIKNKSGTTATTGPRLRLDCFFDFLPNAGPFRSFGPVRNNSTLKLHHLTDSTLAKIQFPGRKEVRPGERVFGRVVIKKPLLMLRGDRFIIRNPATNSTIGGGVVYVPHLSRELIRRVGRLKPPVGEDGLDEALCWLLPENGVGFELDTLALMMNVMEGKLRELLKPGGEISGGFAITGGFVVDKRRAEVLRKKILDLLEEFHKNEPLSTGMKEAALFGELYGAFGGGLAPKAAERLFKALLEGMEGREGEGGEGGEVVMEGGVVRAASHIRALIGKDAEIEGAILKLFPPVGFESVNAGQINGLKFDRSDVARVLKYLVDKNVVVKLKEGAYLPAGAVEEAKKRLTEHCRAGVEIKAAEFRDLLGCGRKLAIEILEYFDRVRVTLRKGDVRTLR